MFDDVRASEIPATVRRDLRSLYDFYLDEERRADLARMGRVRRFVSVPLWLLKSLLLKLTPARRALLLVALFLALLGSARFVIDDVTFSFDATPWGFLILLVVLALELKDKLLARDEIEVARQVQLALLPGSDPDIPGFLIWSHTRPANDVGGDLIDYLDRPSERVVGVALGDVAGKGLGAALLMAKLQASLHAIVPGSRDLVELGGRLNHVLVRDGIDNRFATLVYVEVPIGGGPLKILNAGHNAPLIARKGGALEAIEAGGLPLGMFPGSGYTATEIVLEPGDLLAIYSDGLVEARNAGGEEYGFDRLRRRAPQLRDVPPAQAGRMLLWEIDAFLEGGRPQDDLSIVLITRT